MAFPLIPFVAGAVIGGLSAYFLRDEKLRGKVVKTTGDLSDKVAEGLGEIRRRVGGGEPQPAPAPATTPTEVKKKVTKKRTAATRTKTAAKKVVGARSSSAEAPEDDQG